MTQEKRILEYIEKHGAITQREAFDLGITRLAARVHTMRQKGMHVVTETVASVNRYGEPVHFARYKITAGV